MVEQDRDSNAMFARHIDCSGIRAMRNLLITALALSAACSEHGSQPGADAPTTSSETQPLGMNDVSMILPTLRAFEFGKMSGGGAVDRIPRALYDRLVTAHGDINANYDDFQIFAIRFDLCNRVVVGPCPDGADGSLRVVFQPMMPQAIAGDMGLHAFYTIPAADLGFVVNELRAIARLSGTGAILTSPLKDLHVMMFDGIPRLKALLDKYAVPDHLIQLTMMGQDSRTTNPRVIFRGLELKAGQFTDIVIAGINATEQVVELKDTDPSYTITPVADTPTGFALAMSSATFNAAAPADQRTAVDAMLAAENPLVHTANTVQCAACHVTTFLTGHRAQLAGIDVRGLPSSFSTTRDVSVTGGVATTNERSLHNFSWMTSSVAFSHRVANETAVVLDEIERRFPIPAL